MVKLVLTKLGLKRLEPYDGKLSSTVLRGRRSWQLLLCYPTIDKAIPTSNFNIKAFYDSIHENVIEYSELLENLSDLKKELKNANITDKDEKKLQDLINGHGAYSQKNFKNIIEKLKGTHAKHFQTLKDKNDINSIFEYFGSIQIDQNLNKRAKKQEQQNIENIKKYHIKKCLEEESLELKNLILQIIQDSVGEPISDNSFAKDIKDQLKNIITGNLDDCNISELEKNLGNLVLEKANREILLKLLNAYRVSLGDGYVQYRDHFQVLESSETLDDLFKVFDKSRFDEIDNLKKIILKEFLRNNFDKVVSFLQSIELHHPAELLDKVIRSDDLTDISKEYLITLGKQLLFDHTKEYSYDTKGNAQRNNDFNRDEDKWQIFSTIFKNIKGTDAEEENGDKESDSKVSEHEPDYTKAAKNILTQISKLENILLELNNLNNSGNEEILYNQFIIKLSAEYLLEDIGERANKLIYSQEFNDYDYISVSKRAFYILNVARKTMAHHPMYIDDEKLEFYVEQLILDSQIRLQQLENKTLENNDITIFSDEFIDFSTRRKVSFEELERKKDLIKSIIFGNGFSDQVIVFNKEMGCNIGVQSDLVFVVFPIEGKASFICELELELSYNLNCDIKVYTPHTLTQKFLNKLTIDHQTEILAVEQFDDFLTTKKFEEIYDNGIWTKARIPGIGDVYKNQFIPKTQFITASEVEYVFSQQYKNDQREKTKQFRQDRIEKITEIRDIIICKANEYTRKFCKVLSEINDKVGLDGLNKLFNILMLDRLLIEKIGEYFLKHEYQIQTKFPELSTITKNGFVNYAYDRSEEFFRTFSELTNYKELILKKKSEFESLDVPMKKEFDKLGFIISQLRGTKIVEHIKKNIIHFLVKDNDWLLMPAIFTNLKGKYCDDSNILKIWLNKNLIQINSSLQKYGYLFGVKNVQIPEDFLLLEFSGEVEYAYLKQKKSLTNQLQVRKIRIINQIFLDGLSVLETLENTPSNSIGYNYRIPHISNSILGFSSELDQDLMHIHEQISGGNIGRKPLIPNLFIENFIDRINELLQQNNIIAVIPRIDTTCRFTTKVNTLKDLLGFHKTSKSIFEEDTKKIADYYEFRHLNDELNTVLCRIDKCIQKAKNLQELISKNSNVCTIQLQQQKLEKVIDIFKQDYEIYNKLVEEIFNSSYVKERIIKILQNPFELQSILDFVQYESIEKQDNLLKNIISNAINIIKFAIKKELYTNDNLSKETVIILTDHNKFNSYLATLQKSLIISDENALGKEIEEDKYEGYIFIEGRTIPCLFIDTENTDSSYKEVLIGEDSVVFGTMGYFGVD